MSDSLADFFTAAADAIADARDAATGLLQASLAKQTEYSQKIQQQAEAVGALAAENARLTAALAAQPGGLPVYFPGMAITDGMVFTLPPESAGGFGGTINITAKRVTCVGGMGYPVGGPLFRIRPGADDFTSLGTYFHHPNPPKGPDGKRDVDACVFSEAKGTAVIRPRVGTVGEFFKRWPGADDALLAYGNAGPDVWSALVGCWGADRTVVCFTTAPDSITENLVRFSPQTYNKGKPDEITYVPRGAVVVFNRLANPGVKTPCDVRNVRNAFVGWNHLTASRNHACVGIANAKPEEAGARNVYVVGNECVGGNVHTYGAADRLVIDDNTFYYDDKPDNVAIFANSQTGILKDFRATNNRIVSPVPQKTVVGFSRPDNGPEVRPPQLDERGNVAVTP